MQKLTEFFEGIATAFNNGTLSDIKSALKVPTAVHIDTQVVLVKNAEQGMFILNMFRNNLLKDGFERVCFTINDMEELRGGATKVSVEWRALNSLGGELTTADARYICDYTEQTGWQVSIIEFDPPKNTPKGQFLGGLPLI